MYAQQIYAQQMQYQNPQMTQYLQQLQQQTVRQKTVKGVINIIQFVVSYLGRRHDISEPLPNVGVDVLNISYIIYHIIYIIYISYIIYHIIYRNNLSILNVLSHPHFGRLLKSFLRQGNSRFTF